MSKLENVKLNDLMMEEDAPIIRRKPRKGGLKGTLHSRPPIKGEYKPTKKEIQEHKTKMEHLKAYFIGAALLWFVICLFIGAIMVMVLGESLANYLIASTLVAGGVFITVPKFTK